MQLQSAQLSIGTRVLLYSPLVGGAVGLVFTLQGIVRTCLRYTTAHKLFAVRDLNCTPDSMDMHMHMPLYHAPQVHGPTTLRFPIRRANVRTSPCAFPFPFPRVPIPSRSHASVHQAERFLGTFIASQFTGMLFTIFLFASMGVILAFLVEDWPGSSALKRVRKLVSHVWHSYAYTASQCAFPVYDYMHLTCHVHIQVVLSQLCLLFFEMFVLRPVIAPLFHDLECGPVLLIIKLWSAAIAN